MNENEFLSGNAHKDQKRGNNYFEILKRSTSLINWLFLAILLFAGINFSMLYVWYFGNVGNAVKGNFKNISNIDTLYEVIKNKNEIKNKNKNESVINDIKIHRLPRKDKSKIQIDSLFINDGFGKNILLSSYKDTTPTLDSARKRFLIYYFSNRLNNLQEMETRGMISTIPFLGLSLFNGDFLTQIPQ
jgi:hypothetical protein